MYAPITYIIYLNLQSDDIVLSTVNNNINLVATFWKIIAILRIVENINCSGFHILVYIDNFVLWDWRHPSRSLQNHKS